MKETTIPNQFEKTFSGFEKISSKIDPEWVKSIRKESLLIANSLGLPTARRGNEEWKYTDIKALNKTLFSDFST